MIKILTFFLALSTGVHPLQIEVDDEVAQVEIFLDGETVGVLQKPPWTFNLDLGSQLLPHRLTVVGWDHRGEEVDQVSEWINLSVPEQNPATRPQHSDPSPGALPAGFTPVLVELERGSQLPPPEDMTGWFLANGEALTILHVEEEGPAEVIVVRDPAIQFWFETMAHFFLVQAIGTPLPSWFTPAALGLERQDFLQLVKDHQQDPRTEMKALNSAWKNWNQFLQIDGEIDLRFLSPLAAPASTVGDRKQIFNVTKPLDAGGHGLLFQAARIRPLDFELRIADAVALAGLESSGAAKRRAVLTLLTKDPTGRSRYTPKDAREYLAALGIPLFVWSFQEPIEDWNSTQVFTLKHGQKSLSPNDGNTLLEGARVAFEDLRRSLARQRIVWLEGSHLPQEIELSAQATNIQLAGRPRPSNI